MKLKPYLKYKPSGIEWLGNIPEDWLATSLSRVLSAIKDGTHGTFERVQSGRPLLSAKNVENGVLVIDSSESQITEDDYRSIVSNGFPAKGDLLLTIVGTIGRACVFLGDEPAAFQRSVAFLRFHQKHYPQFFYYFTQSRFFQEQLLSKSKASAQAGVYMGDVSRSIICVPPPSDQRTITDFLDHETAKIDALIAKQEKLIELLKEKRQAVVSHAVTKGLDPTVPMKPSGVEWLGDAPKHWVKSSIKHYTVTITDGAHVSPETENGVYHFVSTRDLREDDINFDGSLLTSSKSYEYLVKTGCRPQPLDVLFSKDGSIGKTVVVRTEKEFVVASSLIIIRPDQTILDSEYFNFMCQGYCVKAQVEGFVKGAGLPRLSIQNLLKVWSVFPPLDEQRRIARWLNQELGKIGRLIKKAEEAIELQKEHRAALISAAVTGKIDVREAVTDLQEAA